MKQALIFVGAAVIGSAIVLGVMMFSGKPLPYKEMPGLFKCETFGLPDATFNRLLITEDMTLVGLAGDRRFNVGRLAPRDQGAELEFSMETVHFSTFNLDPFFAPRLYVFKNGMTITGRENEKEFAANCERVSN